MKLGNLKDPQKIEAKIADARSKHFDNFCRRAALDPLYGEVLCIGYWAAEENRVFVDWAEQEGDCPPNELRDEAEIIKTFWQRAFAPDTVCIGHNIREFDLPFLLNRSFILGLELPAYWLGSLDNPTAFYQYGGWIDTAWIWRAGLKSYDGKWSLDAVARGCGVGKKPDFEGALCYELYNAGRYKEAEQLCAADVELTKKLARRMGVPIDEPRRSS